MSKCPRLDDYDLRRAINMWWRKFDTAQIAEKLDVEEASVANSLHHWREDERKKRMRAA